ncbi:hypothetical protein H4582DRAFT_1594395 [Lactarius indigo]|nr:hypothetical protein H4582DRAFT_1594395 [Lactarius indigo]
MEPAVIGPPRSSRYSTSQVVSRLISSKLYGTYNLLAFLLVTSANVIQEVVDKNGSTATWKAFPILLAFSAVVFRGRVWHQRSKRVVRSSTVGHGPWSSDGQASVRCLQTKWKADRRSARAGAKGRPCR